MPKNTPTSEHSLQLPEFDEVADLYWRLGVMQSPSRLQGFLSGQLVVAEALAVEYWLQQVESYIDAVEAPNDDDNRLFTEMYRATCHSLIKGDMAFRMLLPDDEVEITQRIDSLSQWCEGFLAGFALAGKDVERQQGQRQYSTEVSEALSDIGAISQIGLSEEDDDEQQRERDYFELSEYLRLAAITLYTECRNVEADKRSESGNGASKGESAIGGAASLFGPGNKKLH